MVLIPSEPGFIGALEGRSSSSANTIIRSLVLKSSWSDFRDLRAMAYFVQIFGLILAQYPLLPLSPRLCIR